MIKNIDLGAVTSYALAVKHGYQGTEEEFSIILANSANYAKEAKEAKEASEISASEAETHKNNAEKILEDVNTAGAEQIRAIENAGAEQKEIAKREIAQKGAETLDSIPEDYIALQGDVGELKSDIGDIENEVTIIPTTKNLYSGKKEVVGYLGVGGVIVHHDSWKTSYYIDVSNITSICCSRYSGYDEYPRTNNSFYYLTTYNKNKELIETKANYNSNVYTVEDGVHYIRFSHNVNSIDIMVESGNTITSPYIPFEYKVYLPKSKYVEQEYIIDSRYYKTPFEYKESTDTDWTNAFNRMFAEGGNIIIPSGTYEISGTISIDKETNCMCYGSIIQMQSGISTIIIGKGANYSNIYIREINLNQQVFDYQGMTSFGNVSVGIRLENVNQLTLTVNESRRFTIGIDLLATDGYGCSSNFIQIKKIYAFLPVRIMSRNRGYANNNKFNDCNFSLLEYEELYNTNYTQACIVSGSFVTDGTEPYVNNANIFKNISLECNVTSWDKIPIILDVNYAQGYQFDFSRIEFGLNGVPNQHISPNGIYFRSNALWNEAYVHFIWNPYRVLDENGNNYVWNNPNNKKLLN